MGEFKKLRASDVVIRSPGMQIKEKIIQKYGSIEEFSLKSDLYPNSVRQYLYSKSLGSSTFKVKLTLALNTDFHDLYNSDNDQIKSYVYNLADNINEYNKKNDIELIEKLKKMCFEREMLNEYITICWVYGTYYYNMNKLDRAVAYMDLVIDYLKNKEGQNRLIHAMSDLGLILCLKQDNERLTSLVKHIYNRLMKANEQYIYDIHKVYYNLGIIEEYLGEKQKSLKAFQNSLEFAKEDLFRAKVIIAIGDYFQNQEEYEQAKNYYDRAEELIKQMQHIGEEKVLNNSLARLFYHLEKYEDAEKYIDKVFYKSKEDITSEKNNYLILFAKIKSKLLKSEDVLNMIKHIIDEEKKEYIYYLRYIDSIGEVIEYMKDNNEFLVKLKEIMVDSIKSGTILDKEILNRFKRIIGDIITKL